MARIRTIKPEFPHSESMGAVSRDARLLFILLWTLTDDYGRLRGDSRLLASLLYPYDPDARELLPVWMGELEREDCVMPYEVDGHSYVLIKNWASHQKIDKPSGAKFPAPPDFIESSRILANPREVSCEEGKGRDQGIDQGRDHAPSAPKSSGFVKPTPEEVHAYMIERLWMQPDGQKFFDSYEAKDWMVGKNPMKDWKAAVRTWETSEWFKGRGSQSSPKSATPVLGVDYINVELENGDIAEFKPGYTADDHKNPDAWFDRAKWGNS